MYSQRLHCLCSRPITGRCVDDWRVVVQSQVVVLMIGGRNFQLLTFVHSFIYYPTVMLCYVSVVTDFTIHFTGTVYTVHTAYIYAT